MAKLPTNMILFVRFAQIQDSMSTVLWITVNIYAIDHDVVLQYKIIYIIGFLFSKKSKIIKN